jgi:hypothetical protein
MGKRMNRGDYVVIVKHKPDARNPEGETVFGPLFRDHKDRRLTSHDFLHDVRKEGYEAEELLLYSTSEEMWESFKEAYPPREADEEDAA